MRLGRFRDSVTIQQYVKTGVGDLNEPIFGWQTFREALCEVTSKRGREHFENGQRYNETVFIFRFHYSDVDGMTTAMRIVFEGQNYDIRSMLPDYSDRSQCIVEATVQDETV